MKEMKKGEVFQEHCNECNSTTKQEVLATGSMDSNDGEKDIVECWVTFKCTQCNHETSTGL